jgi:monofunctional glycosyltransferase
MPKRTSGRRKARARPLRRLLLRPLVWLGYLLVAVVLWVAAYRLIDPPGGFYMASEAVRLGGVERDWRDLDDMTPALARSAMAAEDARFCAHMGFDFDAIREALEANREGGRVRGASTISQQVAKNVFLWHGRSWVRKGLEAGFTVLVEVIWPKRRILEVYLNTAEFAPGVFGAEAAARHHFGRAASGLSADQAARLAAVLPNPKERSAADPSAFVVKRARAIRAGAATLEAEGRDVCVF